MMRFARVLFIVSYVSTSTIVPTDNTITNSTIIYYYYVLYRRLLPLLCS